MNGQKIPWTGHRLLIDPVTTAQYVRTRGKAPWWAWVVALAWDGLIGAWLLTRWIVRGLFATPTHITHHHPQVSAPQPVVPQQHQPKEAAVKVKAREGKRPKTGGYRDTHAAGISVVAESLDELVDILARVKEVDVDGFDPGRDINLALEEMRDAAQAAHEKANALLSHESESPATDASGEHQRFMAA